MTIHSKVFLALCIDLKDINSEKHTFKPTLLFASLSLQLTYSFIFFRPEKYFSCFPDDKQRSITYLEKEIFLHVSKSQ